MCYLSWGLPHGRGAGGGCFDLNPGSEIIIVFRSGRRFSVAVLSHIELGDVYMFNKTADKISEFELLSAAHDERHIVDGHLRSHWRGGSVRRLGRVSGYHARPPVN